MLRCHLRRFRNKKGLKQVELSNMTDIPQYRLSLIETGKAITTKDELGRLSEALNIPTVYIYEDSLVEMIED